MTLLKFDHFTATLIRLEIKFWRIQTVQKCHFLAILESHKFQFGEFWTWKLLKFTKNQNSEPLTLPKMTFLKCFNSPFNFKQKWSGSRIIQFWQTQALTSHFESFWSIVPCGETDKVSENKSVTQCGNSKILLPLKFSVKTVLASGKSQKWPFWQFHRLWV